MRIRSMAMIGCVTLPLALLAAPEKPDPPADQTQHQDAKADRHLAEKIQKAVVKDESRSLSASAHSVKVIVENGVITLKGTVQSDEESQAIQGEAEAFAVQARDEASSDAAEIHNELTVSPSN